MGLQVATFCHVCYSYVYMQAITDEVININVVYLAPMNIARKESCKGVTDIPFRKS